MAQHLVKVRAHLYHQHHLLYSHSPLTPQCHVRKIFISLLIFFRLVENPSSPYCLTRKKRLGSWEVVQRERNLMVHPSYA